MSTHVKIECKIKHLIDTIRGEGFIDADAIHKAEYYIARNNFEKAISIFRDKFNGLLVIPGRSYWPDVKIDDDIVLRIPDVFFNGTVKHEKCKSIW